MIYALFESSKTFALLFLLNDYFRRHYTNKHNEYCLTLFYYLIYTYTHCQIVYQNSIKYVKEQMPCIFNYINELTKQQPNKRNIEFIKDGVVIGCNSKQYYLSMSKSKNDNESKNEGKNDCDSNESNELDFVLYTDASSNPYNVKVIHCNDNSFNLYDSKIYETQKINIKFMLVEIIIGINNYKIDLVTEKYNFYVKDNILDLKFFLYYLHNIHPDKVFYKESIIKSCNVLINIIDHNVNIKKIYLNEDINECICFNENGYEVISKQT